MSDTIEYGGARWAKTNRGYYSAPRGHDGESFLHRQICADVHGPIPPGWLVHHLDEDRENNDPTNLVAVSRAEHARLHQEGQRERLTSPEWLDHLARIRGLAVAWHQSDEGRAWHQEHGRRTWAGREPCPDRPCEVCGESFAPMFDRATVCSQKCHARKRRASGLDDEDRICAGCGGGFRVNRHKGQRFCSRSCAGRAKGAATR